LDVILVVGLVLLNQSVLFGQGDHANTKAGYLATPSTTLKIITINVWSGLDYHGNFKFGEYESAEKRELRFRILVKQLRDFNSDVLFVQEANPVAEFAVRLADSLGYDEVHQVCNAGIKILGFGPPTNFDEGIAILARKGLHLKGHDVWKLSGQFGIFGDFMTVNFDEAEFAEVAEININNAPIFLINLHLSAFPPEDSTIMAQTQKRFAAGEITQNEFEEAGRILSIGHARRLKEVDALLDNISELSKSVPIILGGDFNSSFTSIEIARIKTLGKFLNAFPDSTNDPLYTWDPVRNPNIKFSTQLVDANGKELGFAEKLSALYDSEPRTIDYLFIDDHFRRNDIQEAGVVLDSADNGVYVSDHFGIMADIDLSRQLNSHRSLSYDAATKSRASIEPLPIVSYDTDTRFGYGAKLFLFDMVKAKESLDLVAFNSTKGERWYRAVFSYPDFEFRQGTVYPFAFDFTFDYDKWIKNNFYGVGNGSSNANHEQYTREPVEFDFAFSRGFTPNIVARAVISHKSIRNFNFGTNSELKNLLPALNFGNATFTSAGLSIRYDTRNSFINPSQGIVFNGEGEFSPKWRLGNTSFTRFSGWFQYYSLLFYPATVFALRIGVQQVVGSDLPVQVFTSIGGTNTMRGYPQDRFLDKAGALVNTELRFPIYWKFGGTVGMDAGKVWQSLTQTDIRRWATSPIVGLRLYMDNFVVRADLGFGKEGTGFYFNFGQLF